MLEPVVEHHDRGAETLLGQAARQVTIGGDEHRHAGQRRASICGSSPDASTSARTDAPSLTTTTPSARVRRA